MLLNLLIPVMDKFGIVDTSSKSEAVYTRFRVVWESLTSIVALLRFDSVNFTGVVDVIAATGEPAVTLNISESLSPLARFESESCTVTTTTLVVSEAGVPQIASAIFPGQLPLPSSSKTIPVGKPAMV